MAAGALATTPPAGAFPYGVLGIRGYPMEMTEDGRFRIYSGTVTFAEGTFAIDGDRLTISDTGGRNACRGKRLNPGSYTWKVRDRELHLTLIKDNCGARRTAFLEAPLKVGFTGR